jgi:hypothetical protein
MARGFFKELFTVEEIKEHSLNGRKCNADKTGQEALPPIDAKRKDAIFGKLQAHNYNRYIEQLRSLFIALFQISC